MRSLVPTAREVLLTDAPRRAGRNRDPGSASELPHEIVTTIRGLPGAAQASAIRDSGITFVAI